MDPLTLILAAIALPGWIASRPVRIALVTLIFVVISVVLLLVSGFVLHGWWQAFFLEAGVGALIAGIVDVAVLSALHDLIEGRGDQKLSVRIDQLRPLFEGIGELPITPPGDGIDT
jgi:hypothetical protein